LAKVIHTLAPEACPRCNSWLLVVHYVGQSWIVDKVVCGKCGFSPLKRERYRWETVVVQEGDF
jgi:ribosomal protein S27AE